MNRKDEIAVRLHMWLEGRRVEVRPPEDEEGRRIQLIARIEGVAKIPLGKVNPTQDICMVGKLDNGTDGIFMIAADQIVSVRWSYSPKSGERVEVIGEDGYLLMEMRFLEDVLLMPETHVAA
jgi:hypothetical protein